MNQIKALSIKKEMAADLAKFAILLSTAILAPLINQQMITGVIVNAVLFISTVILRMRGAVLIALVPSIFALSVGLLPAILAPMIPFIIVGNIILIFVFDFLREKNFWLGIISAGFLKFIFLAGTSLIVTSLLLKKEIAQQASQMMNWPQLLTALAGGLIAFLILKFFNHSKI